MTTSSIKVIAFCCKNAIESDPVLTEKGWHAFEPEIKIVSVPCSSKVETLSIIKAFESGADGIFVLGCKEKHCRFIDGNVRAQRTINHTRRLLEEIDMEADRLRLLLLGNEETKDFGQVARFISNLIRPLGKVEKENA
jgi:coenzyme F420-reducing hydrogenase delta subunit